MEYQVLVALKRFGKYGNGPGMDEISQWSGFGIGTVTLVTRRFLIAIHRSGLRKRHMRWPDRKEKEEAKEWPFPISKRTPGSYTQ